MYNVEAILNKQHRCLGRYNVCGIYQITNIINGKIYIGSSNNILQRWKNHIRELEANKHGNIYLQRDWTEYQKENFIFEVLEQCEENVRYTVEQNYLDKFMPFYRTGNGYNICEKSTCRNDTYIKFFKPQNPQDNYFIVKTKGCKPHVIDADYCKETLKEELIDQCFALDTYCQIRNDMIEHNGYDDWEW